MSSRRPAPSRPPESRSSPRSMNTNVLLLMQGLLAGAQFVNAGLGAAIHGPHSLLICLMVGGVTSGLQVTVQQIGNKTPPK